MFPTRANHNPCSDPRPNLNYRSCANAGVCPTGRRNAHIRTGYGGSGWDDAYGCASRRPYTTVDSSDTNSYSTKTDCYAGCDSRAV